MQIAIVGGGIIGCSAAWRLAQRGAAVKVYDQGRIGGEASWAGAGMLAPGGEYAAESAWAKRAVDSLAIYPHFVEELQAESGLEIDFRRCGALDLAFTGKDVTELRDRIAGQRALGIRVEPAKADRGLEAWFYPDEAVVDPRDVVQALRRAAEHLGVEFVENHQIDKAEDLPADAILIATGAWAPGSFPVKGHLLSYTMPAGSLPQIIRHGHFYVLQRRNGLTIAGSDMTMAGFDRSVQPHAVAAIRNAAETLVPALAGQPVVESWIGFRPGSYSNEPVVERRGESNVWLAYGHFRNGILLAPITARMLAGDIMSS